MCRSYLLFALTILITLLHGLPQTQAQTPPAFTPTECPFAVPANENVECGYLTVPENRSNPASPTIELAVAILRSTAPNPESVIYLEGGPGGSALAGIDGWYGAGNVFRDRYDLILIDQRGTGYSFPSLNCPEADESDGTPEGDLAAAQACYDRLISEGVDLTAYTTIENAADINDLRIALGLDQVILYGVSYGTRLALEVMENHPEGVSRAIIDAVYPPNVQAYIEQAPNGQRSLNELFAACTADPACNAAFPDLEAVFYQTVDRLNAAPLSIDFQDGSGEVEYDGDTLVNDLYGFFYDTSMIPSLPALIYAAYNEDTDLFVRLYNGEFVTSSAASGLDAMSEEEFFRVLRDYIEAFEGAPFASQAEFDDYLANLSDTEYNDWIDNLYYDYDFMAYLGYASFSDFFDYVSSLSDAEYDALTAEYEGGTTDEEAEEGIDDDSEGLFNNIDCNDEMPFQTLAEVEAALQSLPPQTAEALSPAAQFEVCAVWAVPAAPPSENEAVVSDVPTLVLSGSFDPITPPAWGELAAQSLSRSFHYVFPGMGHGTVGVDDCPTQIALDFLADPTIPPDGSCIANMRLEFVTQTN